MTRFKRDVHPGLILKDELAEFGTTPTSFARQITVPPNRINQPYAPVGSPSGSSGWNMAGMSVLTPMSSA